MHSTLPSASAIPHCGAAHCESARCTAERVDDIQPATEYCDEEGSFESEIMWLLFNTFFKCSKKSNRANSSSTNKWPVPTAKRNCTTHKRAVRQWHSYGNFEIQRTHRKCGHIPFSRWYTTVVPLNKYVKKTLFHKRLTFTLIHQAVIVLFQGLASHLKMYKLILKI